MQINKKQVGQRIKRLRHSRNLTLDEVADKIHAKGKSTVNAWERGATLPSKGFLKQLCKLFNVSKEYLFFGSLDEYLLNLVIDDYQSDGSLTHSDIVNYLNLTTERLNFVDSLTINASKEEAARRLNNAETDAIKDAIINNLSSLKEFLDGKLKYNNDSEILLSVATWFFKHSEGPLNSFLGQYRGLMHAVSEEPLGTIGFSDMTVSEVMELSPSIASTKEKALDIIFKSRLTDIQENTINKLTKLRKDYEEQTQHLEN